MDLSADALSHIRCADSCGATHTGLDVVSALPRLHGGMLAGGFVLALGGLFATLATVDTANPYRAMGASRTRVVRFLAELVFMSVIFDAVLSLAGRT